MKLFYHISLTAILFCCYQPAFSAVKDSTPIISVDAHIIARDESINFKYLNDKAAEYFVLIILTNTQDTAISIRIMTCSWSQSFTFDKDSLYLTSPGCDSNFPTTLEIGPHKTVKFFAKLRCNKMELDYRKSLSFRIGFIDLPYEGATHYPYSKVDIMKFKTYWSDNITLESKLYNYEEEKIPDNLR